MIIPQYGWFGDKCVGLIYVYIFHISTILKTITDH